MDLKTFSSLNASLHEERQSLMDTEYLDKRERLNFDGPKMRRYNEFVFDWIEKALKNTGLTTEMRNTFKKHFRDIANMEDATMRREVQKIDAGIRR